MNFLDKARGEAGGASLDMQTAGAQVQGQTWRGIERQYGAKELMAGLMLRTFAETALREVYLLAHRNLRRYPPGVIEEKISGEWVKTDPRDWRARSLADIQVGVAGSQMQERAQAFRETIGMQIQALQAGQGGELTDFRACTMRFWGWSVRRGWRIRSVTGLIPGARARRRRGRRSARRRRPI